MRDAVTSRVVSGTRETTRTDDGRLLTIRLAVEDEDGRTLVAEGEGLSHLPLPHSTSVTWCTALRWTVEGETVFGEDQDGWPIAEWRQRTVAARSIRQG